VVGQFPQRCRRDAADAEGEAEEEAGDGADLAGDQLLRENQDRGKCRRQQGAGEHAEDDRPGESEVRQRQGEGGDAENGYPDNALAPEAVAERAAGDRARRDGEEEREQAHLRSLHGNVESADEIERIIVGEADQVEVFRDDQKDEYRQRDPDLAPRQACVMRLDCAQPGIFSGARAGSLCTNGRPASERRSPPGQAAKTRRARPARAE
jgi:hypothetical protein